MKALDRMKFLINLPSITTKKLKKKGEKTLSGNMKNETKNSRHGHGTLTKR